jgi:hypothetical protein
MIFEAGVVIACCCIVSKLHHRSTQQSCIFHSHTFAPSGSARRPPHHCSGTAPLREPQRRGLVRVAGCLLFRICGYKHGWGSRLAWSCVANILQLEIRFGSYTCVCFAIVLFVHILICFPPGMNSASSSHLIADGSITLRIALAAAAFIPVSTCGVFVFPVVRVIVSSLFARVDICHTRSFTTHSMHAHSCCMTCTCCRGTRCCPRLLLQDSVQFGQSSRFALSLGVVLFCVMSVFAYSNDASAL